MVLLIDQIFYAVHNYIMSKITISIIALASVLVVGMGGYYLYSNQLQKSKNEGKNIISRAIPDDSWKNNSVPNISKDSSKNQIQDLTLPMPRISGIKDRLLKTGQFATLDPAHYAKGGVNIIESGENIKVAFSDDFATNPDGPDLYVWLVKKQEIKNIAFGGVSSQPGDYLELGAIQSKSGSQAYQVTKAEFEANDYAVVIWCRAFGIQFSNAILK
jgi:Electron transfer DM13